MFSVLYQPEVSERFGVEGRTGVLDRLLALDILEYVVVVVVAIGCFDIGRARRARSGCARSCVRMSEIAFIEVPIKMSLPKSAL